jgi:hypothetical protein
MSRAALLAPRLMGLFLTLQCIVVRVIGRRLLELRRLTLLFFATFFSSKVLVSIWWHFWGKKIVKGQMALHWYIFKLGQLLMQKNMRLGATCAENDFCPSGPAMQLWLCTLKDFFRLRSTLFFLGDFTQPVSRPFSEGHILLLRRDSTDKNSPVRTGHDNAMAYITIAYYLVFQAVTSRDRRASESSYIRFGKRSPVFDPFVTSFRCIDKQVSKARSKEELHYLIVVNECLKAKKN